MAKRPKSADNVPEKAASLGVRKTFDVATTGNDNISRIFTGADTFGRSFVPDEYRDTNRFLNLVQWNIEWFGATKSAAKDETRFDRVVTILEALNADLFVFQEVAGPGANSAQRGVIEAVADELSRRSVDDYRVAYTQAGGEQRVAMMWDLDWVRAKEDVAELFPKGTHVIPSGKDAFAGRTPLQGFFTGRIALDPEQESAPGADRFDFRALGVHLKAMPEGAEQRAASAEILARWLERTALAADHDILIVGDWNAPPGAAEWQPFRNLEQERSGQVAFSSINDANDFSYLWLANRNNRFVSRIDLTAVNLASSTRVSDTVSKVVRWKPIEDAIRESGSLTSKQAIAIMKEVKELVSDHLPTVTRFFIKP